MHSSKFGLFFEFDLPLLKTFLLDSEVEDGLTKGNC